jgi:hypothetical protein
MNDLKLGETECFEVWFVPTNREAYSTCVVQSYLSLVSAQEYRNEMKLKMCGTMEVVRVRTVRQLMAVAP